MALELVPGLPVRPLTLGEYEQMVDHGILDEDSRVGFLDGMLVETSPQSELHAAIVETLTAWAFDHLDRARFRIRGQLPMRLPPSSAPEPDLAVVPVAGGVRRHPSTADLVVEVALSSALKDLHVKRRHYAAAGVEEYWVVLPAERLVRVHRTLVDGDYSEVADLERPVFEGAAFDLPGTLDDVGDVGTG